MDFYFGSFLVLSLSETCYKSYTTAIDYTTGSTVIICSKISAMSGLCLSYNCPVHWCLWQQLLLQYQMLYLHIKEYALTMLNVLIVFMLCLLQHINNSPFFSISFLLRVTMKYRQSLPIRFDRSWTLFMLYGTDFWLRFLDWFLSSCAEIVGG